MSTLNGNINIVSIEANVMNISATFQVHFSYFFFFCCKFIHSVAMAINQIQQFGQNSYAS